MCVWAIVADFHHVVQLEFELMDIEESYKCSRDFLEVSQINVAETFQWKVNNFHKTRIQQPAFLQTQSTHLHNFV